MKSKIMWLRISYWAAAIGDFIVAILVLIPQRMGVSSYCYPMGLMSAVAFSWGIMLVMADRKPVERRWMLLPTILVVCLLFLAGIYSLYVGAIPVTSYTPNFVVFPAMITLLSVSYYRARDIESG